MNNQEQKTFKMSRWSFLPVLFGFSGLLDSVYLAAKHYLGSTPPCVLLKGCEVVTTSKFATVGGVSVAVFGAVYYLTVLVIAIYYLNSKKTSVLKFLSRFTVLGVMATAWFLFLQIFILKALCVYCLVSAFSSISLFGLSVYLYNHSKKYSQ